MAEELAIDSKALIFATLADVYLSSGMVDEAISILKDGLSRNPNYTLGKIILGRAYYLKGSIDEALKTFEAIYEEAKGSENENLYLARCYKKIGESEKAVKYYEAVMKINPQNKEAKQELEVIAPAEIKAEKPPEKVVIEPAAPFTKEAVIVAVPIMEDIPIMEKKKPIEEKPVEADVTKAEAIKPAEVVEQTKAEKIAEIERMLSEDKKPAKEKIPAAEKKPIEAEKPVEEKPVTPEKIPAEEVPILPEIGLEPTPAEKPPTKVEVATGSPLDSLKEPMSSLLEIKAVKGTFICSKDGLLIQNYYQDRGDIEEICALIAAIYYEADDSFKFLKEGAMEKCIIEKGDEAICVIAAGESLLCIITKPEAKPGLVFVYARKIIDQIKEILG